MREPTSETISAIRMHHTNTLRAFIIAGWLAGDRKVYSLTVLHYRNASRSVESLTEAASSVLKRAPACSIDKTNE